MPMGHDTGHRNRMCPDIRHHLDGKDAGYDDAALRRSGCSGCTRHRISTHLGKNFTTSPIKPPASPVALSADRATAGVAGFLGEQVREVGRGRRRATNIPA